MSKEIHMEDVRAISLEAMELIENRLKEFGIELPPGEDDKIYEPMSAAIERAAGCPDYRSRN
jgi:acyl carrier protein